MNDKPYYLILWNKDEFAQTLRNKSAEVITTRVELDVLMQSKSDLNGIVILAELTWNENKLTNFYGFDILEMLRSAYRLKCPICLCSFLEERRLSRQYPILDLSQNHPFVQLPATPKDVFDVIESSETADEFRLNDIVLNYCNLNSKVVRLMTHGLGLREILQNPKNSLPDHVWDHIKNDISLLKKYSIFFKRNEITKQTKILIEEIDSVIANKNCEKLYACKKMVVNLSEAIYERK